MKCPRCQHENEAGANFCEECAAPLARTCGNCGRQLSPTAKFCSDCAHPARLAPEAPTAPRFTSPGSYTPKHLGEILAGRRAITADTDLRLCRFFGLSDGWWLRLQADYDTEVAKATLAKTLANIKPWAETAGDAARTR